MGESKIAINRTISGIETNKKSRQGGMFVLLSIAPSLELKQKIMQFAETVQIPINRTISGIETYYYGRHKGLK